MLEGGLQVDDLVTIIGEQTITIRLLRQEKNDLLNDNQNLKSQLEAKEGGDN